MDKKDFQGEKKFWSAGFVCWCFIPGVVFAILHIVVGNYKDAIWQSVALLLLMANNYLLCENHNLHKSLWAVLKDNLELIKISKALGATIKEKELKK